MTPLEDEAHTWVRLLTSGEATTADAEALKRWCGRSREHAAAFAAASQFWRALGPAALDLSQDHNPTASAFEQSANCRSLIGRRAILGGALAASAVGILVIRPPFGLWPSLAELQADFSTGPGEQREIQVSNSVAIQMNTRTSLSIAGVGNTDEINLIAGEASFTTTSKQGSKPFNVIAAEGKTSALSAHFDLRILSSGVCVTCLSDEVQITYRGQSVTLRGRERVTYGEGKFGATSSIDPSVASAWQKGLIIFDMTPLSEVIDELNRYRSGRIVLLNSGLARSPVNGRFRIDRPDEALAQIERAFGVQGHSLPGGFVLLS